MQTADFGSFIRTIVCIVGIYYVIKFLSRLFLPLVIKKVVEKAGENFNQQYNQNYQSQSKDEVIYDTQKMTKPRSTKIVGEYVDYEEID